MKPWTKTKGVTCVALHDPIKDHGAEQDCETGQNALADIGVLQRFEHVFAQTLGTDQRGHHDHRQRQHDGLVDAGADRRAGKRQIDAGQQIPFAGAK